MITRDKLTFDAKVAEVCNDSESNNYFNLDIADFEEMAKGATERVLIELESMTGVDDLLNQMIAALDSLQSDRRYDAIVHIVSHSMIMSDLAKLYESMEKSTQKLGYFKRAVSFDDTLADGHHKLTLFIYTKENI